MFISRCILIYSPGPVYVCLIWLIVEQICKSCSLTRSWAFTLKFLKLQQIFFLSKAWVSWVKLRRMFEEWSQTEILFCIKLCEWSPHRTRPFIEGWWGVIWNLLLQALFHFVILLSHQKHNRNVTLIHVWGIPKSLMATLQGSLNAKCCFHRAPAWSCSSQTNLPYTDPQD